MISLSKLAAGMRLDAEHYKPEYLRYERIAALGDQLSDLVPKIIHPVELLREYQDSGVPVLLAQNIRPLRLDFSLRFFMPESVRAQLQRNRLQPGDIAMTRSGANFGDTACYLEPPPGVPDYYACADCLVLRPHGIKPGYLAVYLNTKMGRALLTRGAYGAAQPHIAPNYLKTMYIPRLGAKDEDKAHRAVISAWQSEIKARETLEQAGKLLSAAIGLDKLDLSPNLYHERSFADLLGAQRFDADYFSPRYQRVLTRLANSNLTIGAVALPVTRKFQPERLKGSDTFRYIEIGSLTGDGQAESEILEVAQAPSRAQWIAEPGDVITSTVRPIRRLSAIITAEQGGVVCSSGFAVLRTNASSIEPEVLLAYLRLPIICEILDLHTTASMYPAIPTERLLKIPVALPTQSIRNEIVTKVRESFAARNDARRLLEGTKTEVERLILDGAKE
jgi:hypothetical protein